MSAPAPGTPLCLRAALNATGAKTLLITQNGQRFDVLVVRWNEGVFGYVNACPHRGTPLETFDDRVFDSSGAHLICSTHGALFRPADGLCVDGPCRGKMLQAIPLRIENEMILVA